MNLTNTDNIEREYSRIPKEAPIEIKPLEYPPSSSPGDTAVAKNIAENGICLTVSKPYMPNTMISLKIDLKGWQQYLKSVTLKVDETRARAPLTAIAEVVWCNKITEDEYETGIRFIDVYEDDMIAFRHYLSAIQESK